MQRLDMRERRCSGGYAPVKQAGFPPRGRSRRVALVKPLLHRRLSAIVNAVLIAEGRKSYVQCGQLSEQLGGGGGVINGGAWTWDLGKKQGGNNTAWADP